MNPSDPVVITVTRGDDIEYTTINMPFIGIQARED